jgi:hypothetical protein
MIEKIPPQEYLEEYLEPSYKTYRKGYGIYDIAEVGYVEIRHSIFISLEEYIKRDDLTDAQRWRAEEMYLSIM